MRRILVLASIFLLVSPARSLAFRPPPTPAEIAALTRKIEADPGDADDLRIRGLDYAVLGQKDKAIADYKASLRFSHRPHRVLWSFGWALLDLGEYDAAVQVWENVIVAEKTDQELGNRWERYTLALGYWCKGDQAQAFTYFTQAAKADADLRERGSFEFFTSDWTEREQNLALQLFDAWHKEIEKSPQNLPWWE